MEIRPSMEDNHLTLKAIAEARACLENHCVKPPFFMYVHPYWLLKLKLGTRKQRHLIRLLRSAQRKWGLNPVVYPAVEVRHA